LVFGLFLNEKYFCKTTKKSIVRNKPTFIKKYPLLHTLGLGICTSLILLSCGKTDSPKNGKNPPSISYVGMSGNVMKAGSNEYINVNFNFSDKDGDLGNTTSSGNFDIYTIDKRDTTLNKYYFPRGIAKYIDPTQGVSGSCSLGIEASFLLLRPNRQKGDTVKLELYIKDKAGNESNRITLPEIYLTP
jgi:hypothetical protein